MSTPYDRVARPYDLFMLPLEWFILRRLRRRVIPGVDGLVLEIGAGTGTNLPLYRPSARLVITEPSPEMLRAARLRGTRADASWALAAAERLPFCGGAFDHVVGTLVFCSVVNAERAAAEARRVLRPGGRLTLIEHTRGSTWITRRLTDGLAGPWHALNGVCHLNRDTLGTVEGAGFRIERTEECLGGIFRVIRAVRRGDAA